MNKFIALVKQYRADRKSVGPVALKRGMDAARNVWLQTDQNSIDEQSSSIAWTAYKAIEGAVTEWGADVDNYLELYEELIEEAETKSPDQGQG